MIQTGKKLKKILAVTAAAAIMAGTTVGSFAQTADEWVKSQMPKKAQTYYDEIIKQLHEYKTTITFKYEGNVDQAAQDAADTAEMIKKQNPDLFWLSYDAQEFKAKNGTMTAILPFYGKYLTDGKVDKAKVQAVQAQLDAVVQEIGVGETKLESVRKFNDYLANNTHYNSQFNNSDSYELTGSLLNGGAVCEGFAKGLKYLCDRAGIDCVEVSGSGILSGKSYPYHEWCYVKMDDGKWYLVDPTWNSLSSDKEKWFLLGSDAGVDGLALLKSHQPDSDKYPVLSQSNYGE